MAETINSTRDDAFLDEVMGYADDPLGFVFWAFPWGQPGTLLEKRKLKRWQREFLEELGEEIRKRGFDGLNTVLPVLMARASGHGIGKSALVAMLIIFIMSTRPRAKGTVTANTENQLRTKTWAELAKWHKMSLTRDWFRWHGAQNHLSYVSVDESETWRCDGQTCREENSESFAGQHSADSTSFYIFDEASAVPDKIYEVASGGLTDGEPMMFAFGNPTRNTGMFKQIFGKLRNRWRVAQIDGRTVEGAPLELYEQWIADWGEDSDYVRVRMKGMFPRASSLQFIDNASVLEAMKREPFYTHSDPLVAGLDVARGGDDKCVIYFRRGMDARSIPRIEIPGEQVRNSTLLVARAADAFNKYKPDAIFVDATGIGGPIADELRRLGFAAYDIGFGETSPHPQCGNYAAYMYAKLRKAIQSGLALPEDAELEEQLTQRDYTHDKKDKLILERKADLKTRGLASPDIADALALTYAMTVQKQSGIALKGSSDKGLNRNAVPQHVYDKEVEIG